MKELRYEKIALELDITLAQVRATAELLENSATVPFIARYRKEVTGSLDEVAITVIRDRLLQLEELDSRRETIIRSLAERNLLTDEVQAKISAAETLAMLEDIYLPFRPKRRTRGMIAREKGLEPLALKIFAQDDIELAAEAVKFIDAGKGTESVEDALAGARDIIAEMINESQQARARLRQLFLSKSTVTSHVIPSMEESGIKYRDYYDWEEPVSSIPSHRLLAIRRGSREEFLTFRITPPEETALAELESLFVKGPSACADQVKIAVHDSYKRLLSNSMETEARLTSKKKADGEAIRVFAENLRQLLLAAPLGQKSVLAIDPGFRTGCKVTCLDPQGKLLHNETIFPLLSDKSRKDSATAVRQLCDQFHIEAIALGNGTAGRETEAFLKSIGLPKEIQIVMVNESGASVYSASQIAREEFPDYDITVKGAVSIGRRLMDPLAELVKIDAKSIGVGQYQHDVDQGELKKSLDDVVISCVNAVGVEVNTASPQLLSYVSGLGPSLAENIVKHRNDNGPFRCREELRNVRRLGPIAFEQAAGFLRIRDGINPLDASAVHPESYPIVENMALDQDCSVSDLIQNEPLRAKIDLKKYTTDRIGLPTLQDIMAELAKPGRDPRRQLENVVFAEGIEKISDLIEGMKLPGVVTNITAFGAFVDIGVHQDGLVHVSEIADKFVKSPGDIVKVNQKVTVTVMAVDLVRNRISLSMKKSPAMGDEKPEPSKDGSPKTSDARRRTKLLKSVKEAKIPFNNPFAEAFNKMKKN